MPLPAAAAASARKPPLLPCRLSTQSNPFALQILPPTRRSLIVTTRAGKHISDQEFVPVFLCKYDGEVTPDQVEVSAVRWATKEAVVAEVQADASKFTPWFVGAPPAPG